MIYIYFKLKFCSQVYNGLSGTYWFVLLWFVLVPHWCITERPEPRGKLNNLPDSRHEDPLTWGNLRPCYSAGSSETVSSLNLLFPLSRNTCETSVPSGSFCIRDRSVFILVQYTATTVDGGTETKLTAADFRRRRSGSGSGRQKLTLA